MEALATIEMVAARSAEAIESVEEIALAEQVLAEASAQVRHFGTAWPDRATAPAAAVAITAAAASRGYMNPAGFQMERGDTQTFSRLEDYAKGTDLTRVEVAVLRPYKRNTGIISVGLTNPDAPKPRSNGNKTGAGWAPVDDGTQKNFPLGTYP